MDKDAYLERVTGKFFGAKFTPRSPLSASVLEVVLHHNPWYHSTAFVAARYRIVLARVQVGLELSQLIGPFATVFVMNAVDDGSHYCLLSLQILESLQQKEKR